MNNLNLVISHKTPRFCVSSCISASQRFCIKSVVIGIGKKKTLTIQWESKDELLPVKTIIQPILHSVFLKLVSKQEIFLISIYKYFIL